MAVSATLTMKAEVAESGSSPYGGPNFSASIAAMFGLSDGNGAGQANILFAKQRVVASGANDDLDLNGTALQSELGTNIAATSIVGVLIVNAPRSGPANTTTLSVGGGTNPVTALMGGTSPTIKIPPGGAYMHVCDQAGGLGAITPGTADILRVANSAGASATYQIVLLLRS